MLLGYYGPYHGYENWITGVHYGGLEVRKPLLLLSWLSTFASSQFCSRFTVHSFVHTFVHSFAHSFPLLLGAIHKACLTSRGGIFSTNGGGNKLNIICSLTENLDEFKNQHIETCFEIKQVSTSIFKICFDIRWIFCKIWFFFTMLLIPTFSYFVKILPFSRWVSLSQRLL